jgi:hypothetical protein
MAKPAMNMLSKNQSGDFRKAKKAASCEAAFP